MKLAEALIRRAAIARAIPDRFSNWQCSLRRSAPIKKPDVLLRQLNDLLNEQERLIMQINRTNCQPGATGKTPAELIARRESLSLKVSVLRSVYDAAQIDVTRYSNKEIKLVSTIEPKWLQKQIDRLSKELRETTLQLQQLNWECELLP
ncbi:MAG: DIP1984 family protein [Thermoguttaceae bacterium]|nr:DIP1984 family protein [Thermoguttaceae bacterium]